MSGPDEKLFDDIARCVLDAGVAAVADLYIEEDAFFPAATTRAIALALTRTFEIERRRRDEQLTGEQRTHRYKSAADIVSRFQRDDRALDVRAAAAVPDGYPRGGDGGPRGSGVTDSTGSAAAARAGAHNAPAARALRQILKAIDMLIAADADRARALPPDAEPIDPDDCIVCARVGIHAPRDADPKRFAQPNPRCTWHAAFWRENKFDAPDWISEKHARGIRIYDADIARAITEHKRAKRKKRR